MKTRGQLNEYPDCHIERVSSKETYPFLLHRHYAKRIPSISFSFGLFRGKEIVGVLTLGKPASPSLCDGVCGKEYSSVVYELNRVFIEDSCPKNTASYFISRCLGYLRPPPHSNDGYIIVSYADTKMAHCGIIYQSSNWIYTGITKERTDIGNEDGSHSRHYDKDIDYKKNRKFRSSKHRYVYFIGSKQFKRKMLLKLNYTVKPYPKNDAKHYDTGKCEKQIYLF